MTGGLGTGVGVAEGAGGGRRRVVVSWSHAPARRTNTDQTAMSAAARSRFPEVQNNVKWWRMPDTENPRDHPRVSYTLAIKLDLSGVLARVVLPRVLVLQVVIDGPTCREPVTTHLVRFKLPLAS